MIISIEGDQAGKDTQTKLLVSTLEKKNIKTTFSFTDYNTQTCKEMLYHLKDEKKFSPKEFHSLMAKNRLDEINKAKSENKVIEMNRYCNSQTF